MPGRKSRRIGAGTTNAIHSLAEALERRVLLSTVSWTGGGDGVNWSNPLNWSGGKLPVDGDDVVITLAGQTKPINVDTNATIGSLVATDPLAMSANSLTLDGTGLVHASSATNFTITGGSLIVMGNGISFTDSGSASSTISGATLSAQGGASETFSEAIDLTGANLTAGGGGQLLFPAATTYTGNDGANTTIQASGAGSRIGLAALTTFAGGGSNSGFYYYSTSVLPTGGGEIDLAGAVGLNPAGANLNLFTVSGNTSTLNLLAVTRVANTTVTAASGTTLDFPSNSNIPWAGGATITTADSTGEIKNDGVLSASGITLPISAATFVNDGVLTANGGTLNITNSVQITGSGVLSFNPTGKIDIGGNLLGATTNASLYSPQGIVQFDGAGTAAAPEELEAMSDDLGAVSSGFNNNFAYSTLALSNNTYLKLVDLSKNSTGTGAEAVYANTVVVPAGSTLNLNGLHLYARAVVDGGTIIGGTVTIISNPPAVTAVMINGDDPSGLYTAAGQTTPGQQRSMVEDVVYTFNQPVTITNANLAFTLAVAGPGGGTLPSTLYAQAVSGSYGVQWAVSLTGQPEGTLASIANGEYSITINPAGVFAAADGVTSMAPGTGRTDKFYRLYGDVFGTQNVTALDYSRFKGSLTTYNPMFDNYNTGNITALDYAFFKKDLSVNYSADGFVTTI